jgi:hypothetical protein
MAFNHNSLVTVDSELAPGVVYRLYRNTAVRRAMLLLTVADTDARIHQLLEEATRITAQPPDQQDITRLALITQLVQAQVTGVLDTLHLQWALHSVDGITIQGNIPDVNTFITQAPNVLVQECLSHVHAIVRTPDALQNDPPQPSALVN